MSETGVVKAFWDDQLVMLPLCQSLLSNFGEIKREITAFIHDRSVMVEYPKYLVDDDYQLYDNHWTAYPMTVFRGEHVELNGTDESKAMIDQMTANARARMPLVSSIIAPYEEQGVLANSFISRLLPGSIIRPHTGWATDWMRLHLGIICDPGCEITVGDRTRTWEQGQLLAFSDAGPLPHSVKHDGTGERVIFSVDLSINWLIAQGCVDPASLGLDRYLK